MINFTLCEYIEAGVIDWGCVAFELTRFFVTQRGEGRVVPNADVRLTVAAPPLGKEAENQNTRPESGYREYYHDLQRENQKYYPALAVSPSVWRLVVRVMVASEPEDVYALAAHLCLGVCDVGVDFFPVASLEFSTTEGMR
jgi:hypothetical protein